MILAFKLFSRIKDTDFEYIYKGGFSQKISNKLLALAETNVKASANTTTLKNKIYFVMVEGLQNVTKHQDKNFNVDESGMFAIQKSSEQYFITTGNVIKKEEVGDLEPKLAQINILEKEQLTKIRKEILLSGELSKKGGAGLGLIEMARKSGKKLLYDFEEFNQDNSFFYFRTEIPGKKSDDIGTAPSLTDSGSIEDVKKIHKKLNQENILINFNGRFNRNNILSLLSVIKNQMDVSVTSRKVYAIMVEMLQNISKHTNDIEGVKKNRGIFYLRRNENDLVLTSGNYILNSEVKGLKKSIGYLNSLDKEQLYKIYDSILLGNNSVTAEKTGLGFIDMLIKSGNKLNSYFKEIDNELSFFALQATVKDNE